MKRSKRMLALLLAALLILSAPALAAEVELPAENETAPAEDAVGQAGEEQAIPVQAEDAEDEAASVEGAAAVANAEDVQDPQEIPADQGGEDALAEAAGVQGEPEEPDDQEPQGSAEATEGVIPGGAADNDALFEGYAADVLGLPRVAKNRRVGLDLTGTCRKLYDALAAKIQKVASGALTSTAFTLTPGELGAAGVIPVTYSAAGDAKVLSSAIGMNFSLVLNTLISDYPYELYWFDKTVESTLTYHFESVSGGVQLTDVVVKMQVCREYAAGTCVLNAAKVNAVTQAAANAKAIVNSYKSRSDEDKVRGYVTEICNRVSYNNAALSQANYGNPWQLVWVFDGDASTNVVCEGYAKALKYLCDLTSFSGGVHCYTMTGTVSGAASGGHMWNVVTLSGGKNYLVDATFTDGGYAGLVLATPSKVVTAGKSYTFTSAGRTATYTYDNLSLSVFPESVRTLAAAPVSQPAVQSVSLGGTIYMVVGDVRALTPTYSPTGANPQGLTWASSNAKIASVNGSGVVRAVKAGTARIGVRTGNGKIGVVTVQVVKKAKVKKVYLSRKGTLYLPAGSFCQLSASYTPWNARSGFKWSSSKKKVAAVNGSGLVYAKKKGKATITVKAGGKKARVKVVVY